MRVLKWLVWGVLQFQLTVIALLKGCRVRNEIRAFYFLQLEQETDVIASGGLQTICCKGDKQYR